MVNDPTIPECRGPRTHAKTATDEVSGSGASGASAHNAFAELLSAGLAIALTADGNLSVRPARLIDDRLAGLIRTHRAGLISIVAATDSDPIRRGLLTGRLHGWHLADGIEIAGLQHWHAEALGIDPRGMTP